MKLHIEKLHSGTITTFDSGAKHANSGVSVLDIIQEKIRGLLDSSSIKEITITIETKPEM
jgi:hypothetical protein